MRSPSLLNATSGRILIALGIVLNALSGIVLNAHGIVLSALGTVHNALSGILNNALSGTKIYNLTTVRRHRYVGRALQLALRWCRKVKASSVIWKKRSGENKKGPDFETKTCPIMRSIAPFETGVSPIDCTRRDATK